MRVATPTGRNLPTRWKRFSTRMCVFKSQFREDVAFTSGRRCDDLARNLQRGQLDGVAYNIAQKRTQKTEFLSSRADVGHAR